MERPLFVATTASRHSTVSNPTPLEFLAKPQEDPKLIPTLTNTDSPCPASCRHPRLKMRVKSGLSCSQAMAPIILGRGGRYLDPFGAARGSREATHGRGPGTRYAINFALRAASSACSHAAGSVSATPRATTSWPFLMTSQYQCPSSSLGIMRNSTPFPMSPWVSLRPEMMLMRIN